MLTLIVKFLVKPEQLVAFKQALNTNRLGSQNEPGMREMRFFRAKIHRTLFLLMSAGKMPKPIKSMLISRIRRPYCNWPRAHCYLP